MEDGDELRALREIGVLEHARPFADLIRRLVPRIILPRQDALLERTPREDRDSLFRAVLHDLILDRPVEQGPMDLVLDDVDVGEGPARLLEVADREIAYANVADLSRLVEFLERLHRLLERSLVPRVGPVDLIDVDLVDP